MKLFYLSYLILLSIPIFSQFDVTKYHEFLQNNQNLTYNELLELYPAGTFERFATTDFKSAKYADSIDIKYQLTEYEKELIEKHGFMVSERLNDYTFINSLWDIYKKDLPLYLSVDAIMQPMHIAFSVLLQEEEKNLYSHLEEIVNACDSIVEEYEYMQGNDLWNTAIDDIDVYFTIADYLIGGDSIANKIKNQIIVDQYIELIHNKSIFQSESFFSYDKRIIDFSQMTIRGHYTTDEKLSKYFQTMTWFSMVDLWIDGPENDPFQDPSIESERRMSLLSILVSETIKMSSKTDLFLEIENLISKLAGSPDKLRFSDIDSLMTIQNTNSLELTSKAILDDFRNELTNIKNSKQLYQSTILFSDPYSTEPIELPVSFQLFGQRPILDGFITSNLVYDRIIDNGRKVKRMLPSTLDILFSLGNNASPHLLESEINNYNYSSNISALRYLIDSYDNEFWNSNIYNNWLYNIRSLNPPNNRDNLPDFMQTSAWWQKTMTTQLASWTQLRHNYQLMSAQPYTASYICSFPKVYVEPVPEFYLGVKSMFENLKSLGMDLKIRDYFGNSFVDHWIKSMDTLYTISQKELNDVELSENEKDFLCSMLKQGRVCNSEIESMNLGWYMFLYPQMNVSKMTFGYLGGHGFPNNAMPTEQYEADKFLVADYHTSHMDESDNEVGWVAHSGVGRINKAVLVKKNKDTESYAYVGPVFSYYEFISNDFKRLTSEEWRLMIDTLQIRPDFNSLYLANRNGEQISEYKPTLKLSPETNVNDNINDVGEQLLMVYPNPAQDKMTISFNIIENTGSNVSIILTDINGKHIADIFKGRLEHNKFIYVWDLTKSNKIIAGTYILQVMIDNQVSTRLIYLNYD